MKNKKQSKMSADSAKAYLKGSFTSLVNSFRTLDRRVLFIVLYNMIFYASLILLGVKYKDMLIEKSVSLTGIDFQTLQAQAIPEIELAAETMASFYNYIVGYALLFALIAVAVYGVTNFLIWASITGKKLKKTKPKFALKFLLLNLCWVAVWGIVGFEIMKTVKPESFAGWLLLGTLVYTHLTILLFISYFKRGEAWKAVKKAFSAGFGKLHKFIVPYFFAFVIFMLLSKALQPLSGISSGVNETKIAIFIVFAFYFAWLRIYVYSFAKNWV